MTCDHVSKVVKFGYKLIDGNLDSYVEVWGCTKCDVTSPEPLYDPSQDFVAVDHSKCDPETCFGCKAKGLQLSTGDANGRRTMSAKAYDGELKAYSDAVRQGIEPATTNMKDIQDAVKLSNLAGKAFDSTDNSFKG
jgi:hypothetical protein